MAPTVYYRVRHSRPTHAQRSTDPASGPLSQCHVKFVMRKWRNSWAIAYLDCPFIFLYASFTQVIKYNITTLWSSKVQWFIHYILVSHVFLNTSHKWFCECIPSQFNTLTPAWYTCLSYGAECSIGGSHASVPRDGDGSHMCFTK